jgi:hypothetical protein
MADREVAGSGTTEMEHEDRGRETEPSTTGKKAKHGRSRSRPPAPPVWPLEEVFVNMGERIETVENSLSTLESHTLEQFDAIKEDQGSLRNELTRLEIKVMDHGDPKPSEQALR